MIDRPTRWPDEPPTSHSVCSQRDKKVKVVNEVTKEFLEVLKGVESLESPSGTKRMADVKELES